jgi:ATP-dependent helicase/nuclease subunit B
MTKFLEQTAGYLYQRYGAGISGLCIVLPNRRGGLYLKKYLAQQIGKTSWAPAIYSVEDFITGLSGLRVAEQTQLLFELYEVHKSIEGAKAQPFEEFISWGQQLLGDFNEIDNYLVDPVKIFQYLNEARALSLWNLDNKPLTDFEKQYLHFYNSLSLYYQQLTSRLLNKGLGYPGLIFRQVASKMDAQEFQLNWDKVIFAGFNALTAAEEKIIDTLVTSDRAEVLWDADEYWLENKQQEAGDFIRTWIKKWKQPETRWIGNDLGNSEKNIFITGVPFHIGQVKHAGQLLKDLLDLKVPSGEIAVVLMDEQLLMPLLSSLPEELSDLNITMGLSLDQSPLFDLFDDIFRMQENVNRFSRAREGGKIKFYHRDILKILDHPFISRLADSMMQGNSFALKEIIDSIRQGNKVFLGKDEITGAEADLFSEKLNFLEPVFIHWNKPSDAVMSLQTMILAFRDAFISPITDKETESPGRRLQIETEYLYAFSKILHQLSTLMNRYDTVSKIETFHVLFTQLAGSTMLPFFGEPLKGVQLMGMLETRTLDFSNVILLSANEDLLPSSKTSSSYIPFDIRRDFKLPTHHQKNAVYGYHFYRLLQRAQNVHLLYNSEADELGGGDKSRFIKQIITELPSYNPAIKIVEQLLSTPLIKGEPYPPIIIPKEGDVYEKMKAKATKGFAPTTLNYYRQCPLKFYYHSIAGLEEQKELEDTIDPQILGQAVHDALNQLYQSFKDAPLTKENITSMLSEAEAATDQAFLKKYKGSELTFGKNLLLVRVAKILITKFLRSESVLVSDLKEKGISLTVKFLEQFIEKHVTIQHHGQKIDVRLKGFMDRVDRIGEEWRIVDYKTGRVEERDLKLETLDELIQNPDLSMSFQLLSYAYLFGTRFENNKQKIRAGIIPLKKGSEGFLEVTVPSVSEEKSGSLILSDHLKDFEKILMKMLEEIFDTDVPFIQTEDRKVCEKCIFIDLCGR